MTAPPLQLVLDEAELTAATALLLGSSAEGDVGEVVEIGKVRLQARGLVGRPDEPLPVDNALLALVGTCLHAPNSLAIGLRRRWGTEPTTQVAVSFHRLGELTVEHVSAANEDRSEVHSLTALANADDVVDRVVQLILEPPDGTDADLGSLPLETLERARLAIAAGDSDVMDSLPPELAHAFRHAEIFGQIIRGRDGGASASLTVLSRPGEVWSFLQAGPDDTDVSVKRLSSATLRKQLQDLWS